MRVKIIYQPDLQSRAWFETIKGLVFQVVYPKDPYHTVGGHYVELTPFGDPGKCTFLLNRELEVLEEVDKRKLSALMGIIEKIIGCC